MGCKHCGKSHKTENHYKLVARLSDRGFPRADPRYDYAHRKADEAEKKAHPKGYQALKKIDAKLGRHELAGKNNKAGEITISRKIPVRYRTEVAEHELAENKLLRHKKK